jgi:predicted nucleic acid-binding protein
MTPSLRVLLDTNVVLDVLLRRSPWLTEAESIWQASQDGRLETCITASALIDIYYITRKLVGGTQARQVVRDCLDALTILPVDEAALEQAYETGTADLEDALQIACAARASLDAIITRDPAGFAGSPIAVLSPTELTTRLAPPPATP